MRFDGQVALVTGAGRGLGREHALLLASRGCKVVVNDLGGTYDGTGESRVADDVVSEIHKAGGEAVANYDSVEFGDRIVQTALDAYGRLDIVVNNAGIVTPEPWREMTVDLWKRTLDVNLTGAFSVTHAAWPIFVRQKYGRCIMTASPAIYGAGTTAYSAAKMALIGLASSLQFEARKLKLDIKVNSVIPSAMTRMTIELNGAFANRKTKRNTTEAKSVPAPSAAPKAAALAVPSADVMRLMSPEQAAPLVAWLCHESCTEEAGVFEGAAGSFAQLRLQRSAHLYLTEKEGVVDRVATPEEVRAGRSTLHDFAGGDAPPSGDGAMGGDKLKMVLRHIGNSSKL